MKKSGYIVLILIVLALLILSSRILEFVSTGSCYANHSLVILSLLAIAFLVAKQRALFTVMLIVLLLEFSLHYLSPYKGYLELDGGNEYNSPFFITSFSPFKKNSIYYDNKTEFDYGHHINNLGFKDEDCDKKVFHSLILGDSFVQGVGTDSSNTIEKHFERFMQCDNCVLNMGISGTELLQQFTLLEDLLNQGFSTEHVILNLNSSDINELLFKAHKESQYQPVKRSLLFQFCYGQSFLFRHFSHSILKYNHNLISQAEAESMLPSLFELMYAQVLKYQKLCDAHQAAFYLVFQALEHECLTNTYELQALIDTLDANTSVLSINMNHVFSSNCSKYFWPLDHHFNTPGYKLYSTELFKELSILAPDFIE